MKKITKMFLMAAVIAVITPKTFAQISVDVSITANVAPPALPVYVQPACPTDGYMWVPGYWAYDPDMGDYYWVPGVWVAPPRPGLLWTPAYWGFVGGVYGFHAGYWGPHVGFYGGINYGYGYGGHGYGGGVWAGNSFRYNTAVVNVNNTVVHNTYVDRTVIVNNTTVNNHASFNGAGGVQASPRPEEVAAMHEQHVQPTSQQLSHEHNASQDKSQFAKVNNGRPAAVAMNKVGGSRFTPTGAKAAPRAMNATNANNAGRNKPNNENPDANKRNADNADRSNPNNAEANRNNADNADRSKPNNTNPDINRSNADKAQAANPNRPVRNYVTPRVNRPAAIRRTNMQRPQQQRRAPNPRPANKPERKEG